MMNNDVLRSVRYMLDISDSKIVEITALTGFEVSKSDVIAFMKKRKKKATWIAAMKSWRTSSMAWSTSSVARTTAARHRRSICRSPTISS